MKKNSDQMSLIFTQSAAKKIKKLVKSSKNKNSKLRIFILGGGCSGFQYHFTLDEKISDKDTVIEKIGAKIVVDFLSLQYLLGATIDYLENLEGSKFIVKNPKAKTTCSCGVSFSI